MSFRSPPFRPSNDATPPAGRTRDANATGAGPRRSHGPGDLRRRPLRLRLFPDPVLREIARPLKRTGRAVEALARDMLELMRAYHGIGLAAPQVGLPVRLIVVDVGEGPVCLVNPSLTPAPMRDRRMEGCLSLPGVHREVERAYVVEARGLDLRGSPVHFEAQGLLARVLQHEVDHLEGILIIDYSAATAGGRSLPDDRGVPLA